MVGAKTYPKYSAEYRTVGPQKAMEWTCCVTIPGRKHLPVFEAPRWYARKGEAEKRAALMALTHVESWACVDAKGTPALHSTRVKRYG